jgi:hypothetical protein
MLLAAKMPSTLALAWRNATLSSASAGERKLVKHFVAWTNFASILVERPKLKLTGHWKNFCRLFKKIQRRGAHQKGSRLASRVVARESRPWTVNRNLHMGLLQQPGIKIEQEKFHE